MPPANQPKNPFSKSSSLNPWANCPPRGAASRSSFYDWARSGHGIGGHHPVDAETKNARLAGLNMGFAFIFQGPDKI